jgi:hypothetical protein
MQECYRLFAVIATTDRTAVTARRGPKGCFPLLCALIATLAALLCGLARANDARAGTPQDEVVAAVPADPTPQGTPPAQKIADDQIAGAEASAIQQQPTNIVISIRIDSPGDNGAISQTNVAVAGANGSNSSSTGQDGGAGQDASTDQQAAANTDVTQDGAGNLVVTVRINSPGNNGPVSQTNAAIGSSNAENTSSTTQGQRSEAPAPSAASTRTPPRRPHRKQAAPRRTEAVASAPTLATPAAPTVVPHGSEATAPRAAHAHRVKHALGARANHRYQAAARAGFVGAGMSAASSLGKAIANAGDLLGTAAPHSPVGAPGQAADVSSSVIVTLLVVLAAGGLFAVWSLRPGWLRQKRLRSGALR